MAKRKGYKYVGGDLWVAPDGSYGLGQVLLIDTRLWDDRDFDELDMASDRDKQRTAEKIQRKRFKQYKTMADLLESGDTNIRVFRIDSNGVEDITDIRKNENRD